LYFGKVERAVCGFLVLFSLRGFLMETFPKSLGYVVKL